MKISSQGQTLTDKISFNPINSDDFRKKIIQGLKEKIQEPESRKRGMGKAGDAPQVGYNPAIPEQAGWTFLINKDSTEIIDAIRPLAIHREKQDFRRPLFFDNEPEEHWLDVVDDFKSQSTSKYILIIGDLQSIPLEFENLLSTYAFVGRLDFDNLDQIKEYGEKVIRIEKNNSGFVNKETTFFATDHGVNSTGCYDPTHFKRFDVEKALIPAVKGLPSVTNELIEEDATKEKLSHSINDSIPGLILTSSRGVSFPGEDLGLQKKLGGSIRCQPESDVPAEKQIFGADDVFPEPFLEGGVFFQQSSFSFGTPPSSEIYKLFGKKETLQAPQIAPTSFVASLPKKLIFHSKGPLAFIGHFDEMLSYTISEDSDFQLEDRPTRTRPFLFALDTILKGGPVGYALSQIKEDYNTVNDQITRKTQRIIDDLRNGKKVEDSRIEEYGSLFMRRYELKNYHIFGDPAVRITQWA